MNESNILTLTIISLCVLIVFIVAVTLIIHKLRRRCQKSHEKYGEAYVNQTNTEEECATPTETEKGMTNVALDDDGLVLETKLRTTEYANLNINVKDEVIKIEGISDGA
ncbi:uncharacterized protein LOC124454406 [Xenia sp. Carnegie-2017]|uniref:uncharacterized protein LOC124454406 n=1 Tax=Xenia sp. Carnegie-2017 TaxID=2897299 RepID=UPI001F048F71|nr:uncharacterized protein LOC124454406 [Xenia sp. Carnegie-2017]